MKKRMFYFLFIFTFLASYCVYGQEVDLTSNIIYSAEPTLEYTRLTNLGNGYFSAEQYDPQSENSTYDFLDSTGKVLWSHSYSQITYAGEGLFQVYDYDSGGNGYVNAEGTIIIPLQYKGASFFSDGLARVEKGIGKNHRVGFIDSKGNIKIPIIYERAGDFHEGMAWVEKDGKYGYINTKGKLVIPFQYTHISDFHEGYAPVRKDGYMGYINQKGKTVIPFIYGVCGDFYNGKAFVTKANRAGGEMDILVLNKKGKVYKSFTCTGTPGFKTAIDGYLESSYIIEYANGEHSHNATIYDQNGQEIPEKKVHLLYSLSESLAKDFHVNQEGKSRFGYLNTKGKEVIPYVFEDADAFLDGYAVIKQNGKYGIIKNPLEE